EIFRALFIVSVSATHIWPTKSRKPRVEKMRRDRINSSIEQLKCLLAPEFLKQQPDTKLEKADILEMTLNFFRINRRETQVSSGFSRCVREIVHFLSKDEMKTESQRRLLKHFQKLQTSCEQNRRESVLPDQNTFSKEMNVNKSSIWRPWWSLTATSSTC
uniref:BHLH domain-containing protein n=1 Tax=Sinocyclocheilus anshuiensis TaxID=1608454 RepID=A0A671M772_9TELE